MHCQSQRKEHGTSLHTTTSSMHTHQVWQALEKVPGHEEWKVRNLLALAMCQAEGRGAAAAGTAGAAGGKGGAGGAAAGVEEALRTLQRAYDMAAAHNLVSVKKEAAVLQVGGSGSTHILRQGIAAHVAAFLRAVGLRLVAMALDLKSRLIALFAAPHDSAGHCCHGAIIH